MSSFSKQQVIHTAHLANIPIKPAEEESLAIAFSQTLDVIKNLKELNTKNVEPTHHVTGLENITREDQVDESQMLSQSEALANAHATHQGYMLVERVLNDAQ